MSAIVQRSLNKNSRLMGKLFYVRVQCFENILSQFLHLKKSFWFYCTVECHWHSWVWLWDACDTAEIALISDNETAESDSVVSSTPPRSLWILICPKNQIHIQKYVNIWIRLLLKLRTYTVWSDKKLYCIWEHIREL